MWVWNRFAVALVLLFGLTGTLLAQENGQPGGNGPSPPVQNNGQQLPSLQITAGAEGVSVFAAGVDAQELLTRLARETGIRLIVDDTVRRTVTINLVNMPVTRILEVIAAAYGLSYREVNGIFMISEGIPRSPSSYLLSDIDTITTQYVLAPNAKSLLPVFLQDHVKTNAEQNAVILSAPPEVLKKFREDIKQFDIPAAQIMVDVLMVEFTDSAAREFRARWGWSNDRRSLTVDSPLGQITFQSVMTLPTEFFTSLRALVTQGKARVHANPRIATVSGQRASIFIGKQRYLSTPVSIGGGGDFFRQTNFIDAGVRLNITPWTGGEGEIIVDVEPEISVLSAPDPKTGLPDKSTRRAETTVRVRDGDTIIIGGLVQRELMSTKTKIPILGDIPLIGQFFRSEDTKEVMTEMAIFITPRILSQTGHLPAEQEEALKKHFLQDESHETR
ncbi:MAG: type II secretion system protein GspD [Chthonomonadetes bacterium]|nr:type II secretion system protein GspD [Chthonomonadetes bacterium]